MNFVSLPHPSKYLVVEPLDYSNPYDYHTPHRHDYFEIILVREGGGEQHIDFTKTKLESNGVYVIYPGQIHLLRRDGAQGLLIQFRKDVFEFMAPLKHHYLYFNKAELNLNSSLFGDLFGMTEKIREIGERDTLSQLATYKSYSYLQIILITLIEFHNKQTSYGLDSIVAKFLQLVSQHIKGKRRVSEFAEMLNVGSEKLSELCKSSLGTTPLKIIHEELLLEIKRMMVLGNATIKEISYELNFESTSHFSSFVKNAAGMPPSNLMERLRYKTA